MATYVHSHYAIFLELHGSNGYANASQCYVTCTMTSFYMEKITSAFTLCSHSFP